MKSRRNSWMVTAIRPGIFAILIVSVVVVLDACAGPAAGPRHARDRPDSGLGALAGLQLSWQASCMPTPPSGLCSDVNPPVSSESDG